MVLHRVGGVGNVIIRLPFGSTVNSICLNSTSLASFSPVTSTSDGWVPINAVVPVMLDGRVAMDMDPWFIWYIVEFTGVVVLDHPCRLSEKSPVPGPVLYNPLQDSTLMVVPVVRGWFT